jgi:hypothetical protein
MFARNVRLLGSMHGIVFRQRKAIKRLEAS